MSGTGTRTGRTCGMPSSAAIARLALFGTSVSPTPSVQIVLGGVVSVEPAKGSSGSR